LSRRRVLCRIQRRSARLHLKLCLPRRLSVPVGGRPRGRTEAATARPASLL